MQLFVFPYQLRSMIPVDEHLPRKWVVGQTNVYNCSPGLHAFPDRGTVSYCSFSGGLFFAKPMRDNKYITMMDPFQIKYGNVLSGALVLPALLGDILWVSCTLLGLGEHTCSNRSNQITSPVENFYCVNFFIFL